MLVGQAITVLGTVVGARALAPRPDNGRDTDAPLDPSAPPEPSLGAVDAELAKAGAGTL